MEASLLLEYGWVLLVLVGLEGILAADNALVTAVMVKHLPSVPRRKALFYGLAGAFVFRLGSLFIISYLVDIWQIQAIGALYLLFIAGNHIVRRYVLKKDDGDNQEETDANDKNLKEPTLGEFWGTVLRVELADIAFAVDSILAAVALAVTLPATNLPSIGSMDGAQFLVVFFGGLTGVIIMRFAAMWFVGLLHRRPGLETAAFAIVGWVGVKLVVFTLAHPEISFLHEGFPESTGWKLTFWIVFIAIALGGWFLSSDKSKEGEGDLARAH